MKFDQRAYLIHCRDTRSIRCQDDTPDMVYEDIPLPHVTAWLKGYHAECAQQHPTYAARLSGDSVALAAVKAAWLTERRAHLDKVYGG